MSRVRLAALSSALFVVAALVAAPLPAAAATAPGDPGTAGGVVVGEVSADGNVVGATVTLRDRHGDLLDQSARTSTLAGGAFALRAEHLPRVFRVEASGGRVDGKRFGGMLVADVDGYDPDRGDLVSVNPATTLVARYLDRHDHASLAKGRAVVARFLGLDSPDHLAFTTSVSTPEFDPRAFAAAARRNGDFDAFVDSLVREADQGRRHPFVETSERAAAKADPGSGAGPTDIAAFLFEALRAQANTPECRRTPPAPHCKEQPFGDLLRMFASPTEKALAEITAKLDLILQQLAQLQATADTIVGRLDQATYDSVVGFMNPDAINRAMKTLKEVSENCQKSQASNFCQIELGDNSAANPGELRKAIRNSLINNGIIDGVWKRVSGRTLGQTTSGVLDVLPTVVTLDAQRKPVNFFTKERSKALLAALDYFYDVEMSAITLAVNYWRWEDAPEKATQDEINLFATQLAAQQKVFSPLPEGTVLDLRTGLMWATSVFCSTYSSFGPRETAQCPAKYAGFNVTDQRLVFPGYPYLPYFTSCVVGQWCMGTENGIGQLLQGSTAPWGTWIKNQAGITFNGHGDDATWLADVDCYAWYASRDGPRCGAERRFVQWKSSEVSWSQTKDRNAAWYLFVRRPTEPNRYH